MMYRHNVVAHASIRKAAAGAAAAALSIHNYSSAWLPFWDSCLFMIIVYRNSCKQP